MVAVETKAENREMRAYILTRSPMLITEIIQPLTEREMTPDRVTQMLEC